MTVELDGRIRHLMARIDEMTPAAPVLSSQRVRSIDDRTAASGVRRVLVPLVAVAIVVTVIALTMVRHPDPAASRALTLHSVSVGLPEGWTAVGGASSTRDPSLPIIKGDQAAYATSALPAGPVIVIHTSGSSRLDTSQPSTTSTLPNGRRVVIGTSLASNLAADVETDSGRWVGVEAVGIDDDTLLDLAGRLVLGTNEAHFDGVMPNGLELVSTTFGLTADPPLAYSPHIDPSSWPIKLSMTTYGPVGGAASTWISIFPASIDSDVLLAITRHPTPLSDNAFTAVEEGRNGVYRLVDGLAVWASSDTLDTDALVAMADGLRPVSDDEWAKLVAGGTRVDNGVSSPDTSSPDTSIVQEPVTTSQRPGRGSDTPSEVRVVYDVTSTPDGREATATNSDGSEVRLTMRSVGRLLQTAISLADTELVSFEFDLNRQPGNGGGATATLGSGDSPHVFAVVDTNPARYAELRVVDGPTTYRADFTDLGNTGVKIAIIVVPQRNDRNAEPEATIIDDSGIAVVF